jgi:uncharacterized metal-binding protein YceD (DUF177 family)
MCLKTVETSQITSKKYTFALENIRQKVQKRDILLTVPRGEAIFLGIDPRLLDQNTPEFELKCSKERFLEGANEDIRLANDLKLEVKAKSKTSGEHILTISWSTFVYLDCVRSLKEFECAVKGSFELWTKRDTSQSSWNLEDLDGESYLLSYSPDIAAFDVLECVRQDMVMAMPLNPISNEDEEFNWEGKEESEKKPIDPRWAALAQLKMKK